ncbi:microcystin-dependent protein [Nostoc sp. PCC 7524]|uniref:phage tail protein n=1 Tax=Nostoc sp. (strain ATCC 29411 / PCC 7524) TaxID=28072 RepID=UPI00029EF732|nr:tail fiber protein [Nostoc sp. PCC 7524]AFY49918.1 microcystin-dependent protein [Nostoc sp. PCC 7524]
MPAFSPFIGELYLSPYPDFAPAGFLPANGQLLPINQNTALFALLGTTYGGDGRTTFALPNISPPVYGVEYLIATQGFFPSRDGSFPGEDTLIGEILLFPYNFIPRGFAPANGQTLPIIQNTALFSLLGTTYGGDGRINFALPNLTSPIPNTQYAIALQGIFPSRDHFPTSSNRLLGEIALLPYNFTPRGFSAANGQLLSINQNPALFSLLGTTYGGDGQTTFALPNLTSPIPNTQYAIAVDGIYPRRGISITPREPIQPPVIQQVPEHSNSGIAILLVVAMLSLWHQVGYLLPYNRT